MVIHRAQIVVASFLLVALGASAQALTSRAGEDPTPSEPLREPKLPTVALTMDHSHMPIAIPDGVKEPALSLTLTTDAMSGYNLELHLVNYSLVPPPPELSEMSAMMKPHVNATLNVPEGHAHLYVNGRKVRRLYAHHTHLPRELFHSGVNQITVTLNNHGHMFWTQGNRQILATLFIKPGTTPLIAHRFESFAASTPP